MIPPVPPPPRSYPLARHFRPIRQTGSAAALCAALLLSACAQHGVSLRKNGEPLTTLDSDGDLMPKPAVSPALSPLDTVRVQILPVYTADDGLALAPYDTIKYEFSFLGDEYRLLPGDELTVHFATTDPKNDLSLAVQPDGRIILPDTGEVMAMGRTPTELASDIDTASRKRMNQPNASVSLAKSSLSLSEMSGEAVVQDDGTVSIPKLGRIAAAGLTVGKLSKNLSALASERFATSLAVQISRQLPTTDKEKTGLVGFDQVLKVSSDGRLALPELGTFAAAGNSTAFVQTEIQEALRSRYKSDLTVTIGIEDSMVRVVYVDGEVGHPGAYPVSPDMTLLKAVTVAGGVINTGDLSRVILIHRNSQNDVYVYVTNLKDFIEAGAKNNDLAVLSQDIVVIPKTAVAIADQWVDQYITGILPFSRSVGYSYTYGTVKPLAP
jgi:protein involved in polysaccharide export with SLBB domain